eukprot:358784-Chlamydomonas_euryale.AAC.1
MDMRVRAAPRCSALVQGRRCDEAHTTGRRAPRESAGAGRGAGGEVLAGFADGGSPAVKAAPEALSPLLPPQLALKQQQQQQQEEDQQQHQQRQRQQQQWQQQQQQEDQQQHQQRQQWQQRQRQQQDHRADRPPRRSPSAAGRELMACLKACDSVGALSALVAGRGAAFNHMHAAAAAAHAAQLVARRAVLPRPLRAPCADAAANASAAAARDTSGGPGSLPVAAAAELAGQPRMRRHVSSGGEPSTSAAAWAAAPVTVAFAPAAPAAAAPHLIDELARLVDALCVLLRAHARSMRGRQLSNAAWALAKLSGEVSAQRNGRRDHVGGGTPVPPSAPARGSGGGSVRRLFSAASAPAQQRPSGAGAAPVAAEAVEAATAAVPADMAAAVSADTARSVAWEFLALADGRWDELNAQELSSLVYAAALLSQQQQQQHGQQQGQQQQQQRQLPGGWLSRWAGAAAAALPGMSPQAAANAAWGAAVLLKVGDADCMDGMLGARGTDEAFARQSMAERSDTGESERGALSGGGKMSVGGASPTGHAGVDGWCCPQDASAASAWLQESACAERAPLLHSWPP